MFIYGSIDNRLLRRRDSRGGNESHYIVHDIGQRNLSDLKISSLSQIVLLARLTLRRLTSFIYGAPILDVSRSHTTTQHSR